MAEKMKVCHEPIIAVVESVHVKGVISATVRACSKPLKVPEVGGIDFDIDPTKAAQFFEELAVLAEKYKADEIPF